MLIRIFDNYQNINQEKIKLFIYFINVPLDFQDYMKKFTTVDPKFIDDFFSLYDQKTTDYDFVIDFDTVVKWLDISKDKSKKTLIESYKKDIDYKIIKYKGKTHGGHNREIIYLTPDCFKQICQSKKGDEMRIQNNNIFIIILVYFLNLLYTFAHLKR